MIKQRQTILATLFLLATAQPSIADFDRNDLFGLLTDSGDFDHTRAEELFGDLRPISGTVSIGGRPFHSDTRPVDLQFKTVLDEIKNWHPSGITLQAAVTEGGSSRYYQYKCPPEGNAVCEIDPERITEITRDTYHLGALSGRPKNWATWHLDGATFLPGYTKTGEELGLVFSLSRLGNGEPNYLEVFEMYPVPQGLPRQLRGFFLQDTRPEMRGEAVYIYYFQADWGESMQ